MQVVDSSNFLDTYYGPQELKACAAEGPVPGFIQLIDQAQSLRQSLPGLGFIDSRIFYLDKHLQSLETLAAVQAGEELPFFVELEKVFDINPIWIPEVEFIEAQKRLDQSLSGKGELRTRFQNLLQAQQIDAKSGRPIVPLMKLLLEEARRRTNELVPLPEEEALELTPITIGNYGAANWYLGNYRSRLEVNIERPVYTFGLLYQMCHEGYPGHHTESVLKEKNLYRERGFLEQSVFFSLGPQLVIAEGIATLAPEMIFTPQEAAEWLREHSSVFPGVEDPDIDLVGLFEALTMVSPDELGSNLSSLIEAGRSIDDVVEYAMAFCPYSEAQIRSYISWLGSPLSRLYAFTYSHGKRLIQPMLKRDDRDQVIRTLLTEQVTPSTLLARFGEKQLRN